MQIVSIGNVKSCFLWKIKYFDMSSAENFIQSASSVTALCWAEKDF